MQISRCQSKSKHIQSGSTGGHKQQSIPINNMQTNRRLIIKFNFSNQLTILIIPTINSTASITTNYHQIMIHTHLYTTYLFTIKIIFQFTKHTTI